MPQRYSKWDKYKVQPAATESKWDKYKVTASPESSAALHEKAGYTTTQGPPPSSGLGVLGGVGGEVGGAVNAPFMLFAPPSSPDEIGVASQGPGALALYRLGKGEVQSRGEAFKQGHEQIKQAGSIRGAVPKSLEFLRGVTTTASGILPVPGIAGMTTNINRTADRGDLGEMWGRGIADALMLWAGARGPRGGDVTPIDRLTSAVGKPSHAPLTETWDTIKREADRLPNPPRTPDEYLETVQVAKERLNHEFDQSIGPFGRTKVGLDPTQNTPISNRILALITPNLKKTAPGRKIATQLKQAASDFQNPWTLEELNQERIDANDRFYANNYDSLALRGKIRTPAIDHAIVVGSKEMIYPALDDVYGKPNGYFRQMQDQIGNLIDLEKILKKKVPDLKAESSVLRAQPRLSRENLSFSMHPGSTPRMSIYNLKNVMFRPDPYAIAGKEVSRAFNPRPPLPVGRTVAAAAGVGANQTSAEQVRALIEWMRQSKESQQ